MYNRLKQKLQNQTAKIGIVGLGYVGLPLAVEFAKRGFAVTGIDVNPDKVRKINRGESFIHDIDAQLLRDLVKRKVFTATKDFSRLADLDCISICVPTPLNKSKDPDVHYILDVTKKIQCYLRPGQLIALESTTYPGTTRELVLAQLHNTNTRVGRDFFLVYSPERVDPGNTDYTIHNTPKIVSGITRKCTRLGKLLYEQIVVQVVTMSSTEAAEMTKLLENTFRTVNIALVNEISIMCHKLGINVWEVIDAASTKPFGYMKFYPGPGLGGHCLPIDPHYLSWKLKKLHYNARFIELAGEVNSEMPEFVVSRVMDGLNKQKKTVNGSRVMVLGVAYKKDVADIRESPAIDILHILREKGAEVFYHDPHIAEIQLSDTRLRSRQLRASFLRTLDCVVLTTDHSAVNYVNLEKNAKLIVDTRNVFKASRNGNIITL